MWSRRGSLSDAGLAGSGWFVVVLLINLWGEGALSVQTLCLSQRLALVDVEQKEIEGRWAVHAVSEGSDRWSVKQASHSASQSVSCSDDMNGDQTGGRLFGREKAGGGKVGR